MIEGGKLEQNATEVVWTSDPLPNDAIAVPKDFDAGARRPDPEDRSSASREAQAKTILPNHYTGFVAATHDELPDDRGRRDSRSGA